MNDGQAIGIKGSRLTEISYLSLCDKENRAMQIGDEWLTISNLEAPEAHRWSRNINNLVTQKSQLAFLSEIVALDRRNIFYANNCDFFFKLATNATEVVRRSGRGSRTKDSIAVLVCAKSDGCGANFFNFFVFTLRPRSFIKNLKRCLAWNTTPAEKYGCSDCSSMIGWWDLILELLDVTSTFCFL